MKVLVAEDDPVMRKMVEILLQRRQIPYTSVVDGEEAVTAVGNDEYDLVLMDVQMPDVDGFEATRRIREQERASGKHVPIIAMTAWALSEDREKCLSAGMDDYISKPIDFSLFYALMEKYAKH